MMKPKYTEQRYYALSETDVEELEIVCETMNSLSLDLAFVAEDKDAAQRQAQYILDSFSKRLGDVIDNVGKKIFKRKDYVIARKGVRMDMWAKTLMRYDED